MMEEWTGKEVGSKIPESADEMDSVQHKEVSNLDQLNWDKSRL